MNVVALACLAALVGADPLGPGDHTQTLTVGELERTYLVHVPPRYDPKRPTPVVLALHGAAMNGPMMEWFSGLNRKADDAGFIVVYPSGTGKDPFLTWNAGWFNGKDGQVDDVAFIRQLLDELESLIALDPKRVYACGMSNGGMMCYRLAAELSDRIAAIAPVAGTVAIAESRPERPVPVIHFHGTEDKLVPFGDVTGKLPSFLKIQTVDDSIQLWVKLNGCQTKPTIETLSADDDEFPITRTHYGRGKAGAEVQLIVIDGGGHTWPGRKPPFKFLGKSTTSYSANDALWEFFQRHPRK